MYLGSAWYPEQWPEGRWEADLALMRAADMNVVRIGEYAWSRLEPEEGRFELDWLERAVDLAAKHGVTVVMGTPTDAPPAWLTQKYPEVLRVDEGGRTMGHGERRQFSPLSPRYREQSRRIAGVMAERFGKHPNVLGWQIGNEFCMYSYDSLTRRLFQEWLQRRHETLANLNQRWTTTYWSQEYSDWSQIPLPTGWPHPGLRLEFFRFMSEAFRDYQAIQIAAIRQVADPRQWVTHNLHGWEDLDFATIIADADVASWDAYPGGGSVDHLRFGWYSDFCRTLLPRPHWIMETQPGHVNWSEKGTSLPRGSLRAMTWHFVAHGAEAVLFWQWRAALNGQEQYHGSVVGPDGSPRPVYSEAAVVGREMRELGPLLGRARAQADVAVLYSYADQVAMKHEKQHPDFDPLKHFATFYAPLRARAMEVDVLDSRRALEGYRLVVAPHLYCMDDELAARLVRYVRAGGHLLLGPRSGFKDQYSALRPELQPGRILAELLGAHVEEFYTLDRDVAVSGMLGSGTARIWSENLTVMAADTEVLLRYGTYNGWIDGKPALVSRAVGQGRISYLGAWLDEENMRQVMDWMTKTAGIANDWARPPEQVEVCRRVTDDSEVFILINHGSKVERVTIPRSGRDLLGNRDVAGDVELPAYGVAVVVTGK